MLNRCYCGYVTYFEWDASTISFLTKDPHHLTWIKEISTLDWSSEGMVWRRNAAADHAISNDALQFMIATLEEVTIFFYHRNTFHVKQHMNDSTSLVKVKNVLTKYESIFNLAHYSLNVVDQVQFLLKLEEPETSKRCSNSSKISFTLYSTQHRAEARPRIFDSQHMIEIGRLP